MKSDLENFIIHILISILTTFCNSTKKIYSHPLPFNMHSGSIYIIHYHLTDPKIIIEGTGEDTNNTLLFTKSWVGI